MNKTPEYGRNIQKLIDDKIANLDIINFYPNRKEFNSKSKNGRKILIVSILLLLIAFFSLIYDLGDYYYFLPVLALIGFLYWGVKYYDKRENVYDGILYYDNLENVLYYMPFGFAYPGCIDRSYIFTTDIMRDVQFGQSDMKQIVVYAIKNITDVKINDVEIEIYGDIVMTSYNKIEIDKRTLLDKNDLQMSMYSKEIGSMKIPRAYDDFEEFLRKKGFML